MINKKDIGIALLIGIVVLCIVFVLLGFAEYGIDVPFTYNGGDDFQWYLQIKSIGNNGWFWHNDMVGAPFGLDLYDFPGFFLMNFECLVSKVIYSITHDIVRTVNIQFLLIFAMTTSISYLTLRALRIKQWISAIGSVMYGFAPYIFARGIGHFSLSVCYFVPLSILLCIWCYDPEDEFLRVGRRFFQYRKNIMALVFVVLISNNGWGYYPIFTCYLLLMTSIATYLKTRTWRSTTKSLVVICLIAFLFAINMMPVFIFHLMHGKGSAGIRVIGEGEYYGMKIAQLFIPTNTHGIKFIQQIVDLYNNSMPLVNENSFSYLGLFGITGFIIGLLYLLCLRKSTLENPIDISISFLSRLIVFAILLSTIGGFSGLISLFFSRIRGYNRISIFISFMSIAILCFFLQKVLYREGKRDKKFHYLTCVAIAVFVAVCVFDELPSIGQYDDVLANNLIAYKSDSSFVKAIERQLDSGDMVYQLPYHGFPEAGIVNEMEDYMLFTGYIHSDKLRWSYGNMRDREGDQWNRYVSQLPMDQMIEEISAKGFKGIYIDTRAYTVDELNELHKSIKEVIDVDYISSENGKLQFYSLK